MCWLPACRRSTWFFLAIDSSRDDVSNLLSCVALASSWKLQSGAVLSCLVSFAKTNNSATTTTFFTIIFHSRGVVALVVVGMSCAVHAFILLY